MKRKTQTDGLAGAGLEERAFLAWETASRDTLDFKRCYVDVSGDLVAGILLSQIVYWFLPARNGESKLTLERDGKRWLAKGREEWWDECRISGKQFDRAIGALEKLGLVETAVFRFGKSTAKHVRVCFEKLIERLRALGVDAPLGIPQRSIQELPKGQFESSPKVNSGIAETSTLLDVFKTTAETTAESTPPLPLPGGGDARSEWHGVNACRARMKPALPPLEWEDWLKANPGAVRAVGEPMLVDLLLGRGPGTPVFADAGVAAQWVAERCGITQTGFRKAVRGALQAKAERSGWGIATAAELAVTRYEKYCAMTSEMRFQWGPVKFFSGGHWLRPETWPVNQEAMRLSREAGVGMFHGRSRDAT